MVNMVRGFGRIIEVDIVNEFFNKEFKGLKKYIIFEKIKVSISSFVDMYNFFYFRFFWGCKR